MSFEWIRPHTNWKTALSSNEAAKLLGMDERDVLRFIGFFTHSAGETALLTKKEMHQLLDHRIQQLKSATSELSEPNDTTPST